MEGSTCVQWSPADVTGTGGPLSGTSCRTHDDKGEPSPVIGHLILQRLVDLSPHRYSLNSFNSNAVASSPILSALDVKPSQLVHDRHAHTITWPGERSSLGDGANRKRQHSDCCEQSTSTRQDSGSRREGRPGPCRTSSCLRSLQFRGHRSRSAE